MDKKRLFYILLSIVVALLLADTWILYPYINTMMKGKIGKSDETKNSKKEEKTENADILHKSIENAKPEEKTE